MKRLLLSFVVVPLSFTSLACSKPEERFESAVQIVRVEQVEKDADGGVDQIDMEVEWTPCPGDQFQVIRGGKEFAACAAKYSVGDYAPVVVKHFWDPHGYYRWDIERLGDCPRAIEPQAFGSYEKSAECRDVLNHGRVVGFDCNRKPFRELLRRCPWMGRD